ncbi:amidohydrolase family protein [Chloroflexota bacterium]
MIIDAYTHGIHGGYLEEIVNTGGSWAKNNVDIFIARTKENKPHAYDVKLRVDQLDRTGIDLQVVSPPPTSDSNLMPNDLPSQLVYAQALNNNMARMVEDSKGRLIGIGNVPLADFEKGGRQEMDRAINKLGLKGLIIASNLMGKPLDSPEFESFWAHAAETGVAVLIHPVAPFTTTSRSYEAEYHLVNTFGWPFETILILSRLVFSGIMERYPTLKVVAHHLGGGIPFFWGRASESYANLVKTIGHDLPKPIFDYFSLFYYDTAVGGSAPAIKCAHEVFGANRMIFATDAPFGPGTGEDRLETYPRVIDSLGFPEEDNIKIFETNAKVVFNLK